MKTFSFWLTFDFGLNADYRGLYKWLDDHKALECGSTTAFFEMELKVKDAKAGVELLKKEILSNVTLSGNDRIYVIFKNRADGDSGGIFINGKRKQPAWAGFGSATEQTTTIEG